MEEEKDDDDDDDDDEDDDDNDDDDDDDDDDNERKKRTKKDDNKDGGDMTMVMMIMMIMMMMMVVMMMVMMMMMMMMMEEVAFGPWEALSCLALTLKLCRPIVPSADCTTSVAGVYLAKRRTANHPCPVCGKHYVNEGSLRKHLACHPETSQLSTSLRMWPCSVCQAVFTHESGKYNPFVLQKSCINHAYYIFRSLSISCLPCIILVSFLMALSNVRLIGI